MFTLSMSEVAVCWKGQFGRGHGCSCLFCFVLESASCGVLSRKVSWALMRLDSSGKLKLMFVITLLRSCAFN